ncbi:hypothetical protein OEZ85_012578 [Tetradesmus obliquus]|uniref:Uncharacterized protein n=1 Tax=Tetradesmus obliquus TaxID=3088 RepID=A0ABY8U2Y9_TETOB|nr:hypothetical protein OEZ85_012578 [Tetradesmus obliquus]
MQKQKAPAEPKGFGAILGEAADVVVDKWTAAGALAPAYNSRLSEIQIQDEAYIHQQLVKPEESKIKRGLQRLLSLSRSKSGKGVRILQAGGESSRKVRFNEDTHSSKSPAAQQQPGAAGTAAAGIGPVKGSVIKKAVAAPGALKSGIRFAEPASAETGPGSAATGAKQASLQAGHTGQQSEQQPPQTPSFAAGSSSGNWAGSSSGNWEAYSRTGLADKQLQMLRTTMAPQAATAAAAAEAEELDQALGYRPLAIPEETFSRWSSAAGGGSGAVGASRQARTSMDVAPVTAGAASANSAGPAGARFSAQRTSNTGTAPATQPEAGQAASAQLGRRSSREVNIGLQPAGSSSAPDLAAVSAAAVGGPSSSRSSGDATSSKQRRATDYLSTLSSIEALLHPSRRTTGRAGSPTTSSGAGPGPGLARAGSPNQLGSSPRSRHSSSSITASPHVLHCGVRGQAT